MPSWNEVLNEINSCDRINSLDYVRRKYLNKLHEMSGRNIIAYYSGWLQKPGIGNAFMHTFANSPAIRIVENHLGNAIVFNIKQ